MTPSQDDTLRRKARLAALVIAGTMLVWLGVQFAGPRLGLGLGAALFFDLAALASFTFGLIVTYQVWRARQDD